MTTYVRFIDANTIQQAPPTWTWPDGSTTSNFPQSDPATLAAAGFLPYVDGIPPTPDASTIVGPPTYSSDGTKVTSTYALVAKPAAQVNSESLQAKVDAGLAALAAFQTANATARTQLAAAKSAATTKSTSASVTSYATAQSEVRNIYASVATALGQLDAALAALDTATRATATALRLTAGRLDSTTAT